MSRTLRRSLPYKPGSSDVAADCDRCKFRFYSSELQKTWEGLMCCSACWEPRHPQDFVRAVKDNFQVPDARTPSADHFLEPGENTAEALTGDESWL